MTGSCPTEAVSCSVTSSITPGISDWMQPARRLPLLAAAARNNVILRLLAKAGLTYGDIEPVYLRPPGASAALSHGSVDAWVIWDHLFTLVEHRQRVRVIATSKDIVNGHSVYVANPGFAVIYPYVLTAV